MSRRGKSHLQLLAGAAFAAALPVACSHPRTRPVIEVVPGPLAVEVTETRGGDLELETIGLEAAEDSRATPAPHDDMGLDGLLDDAGDEGADALQPKLGFKKLLGDEMPAQLDPEQGPVDLGLSLMVNFGSRHAPYDDAMPPIHGVVPGRPGFSDSVLQVSWRERIGIGYGLHGTAALTRFQDIAIIEGIAEAEFAWFVLGVHASF